MINALNQICFFNLLLKAPLLFFKHTTGNSPGRRRKKKGTHIQRKRVLLYLPDQKITIKNTQKPSLMFSQFVPDYYSLKILCCLAFETAKKGLKCAPRVPIEITTAAAFGVHGVMPKPDSAYAALHTIARSLAFRLWKQFSLDL